MECTKCHKDFPETDLLRGENGWVCQLCNLEDQAPRLSVLHPAAIVALVLGLLPFFISFRHSESSSASVQVDGQVVSATQVTHSMDFVAIVVGFAALAAAVVALSIGAKAIDRKALRLGVAVLGLLLGQALTAALAWLLQLDNSLLIGGMVWPPELIVVPCLALGVSLVSALLPALVPLAAVSTPMSVMYSALVGMRPSLEQIAASSAEPR